MTYVKAVTSERARKYLSTSHGRRKLLETYLVDPTKGEWIPLESKSNKPALERSLTPRVKK